MQIDVLKTPAIPLNLQWEEAPWRDVPATRLDYVVPQSGSHRPLVEFKIARDDTCIAVLFRVHDRYVRSVCQEPQGTVCKDSCVEWFVEPVPGKGYFNFELNCGGFLHVSHVEDPTRTEEGGFKKWRFPPPAEFARVEVLTSMPAVVDPEIATPVVWSALIRVPFRFFERLLGETPGDAGAVWRANFYKCADATSHRHWLTWNPVGELNFHRPQDFGALFLR